MLKTISKVSILMLVSVLLLGGCVKRVTSDEAVNEPIVNGQPTEPSLDDQQGIAIGEPNPSAPDSGDLASGTSPKLDEDAARAMQFDKAIDNIASITLRDIEGNVVDRTFSESEIADIQKAYNESFIMDTAYIEMITGYTMTIILEDGREVFIHSYGDPVFIVATFDGTTYHLGCELIAGILIGE